MLLLHVDYSELKAVKAQRIRKTFISASTISNNLDRGPGSERELSPEITLLKKKKKKLTMKDIGSAPLPFFFIYLAVPGLSCDTWDL